MKVCRLELKTRFFLEVICRSPQNLLDLEDADSLCNMSVRQVGDMLERTQTHITQGLALGTLPHSDLKPRQRHLVSVALWDPDVLAYSALTELGLHQQPSSSKCRGLLD